MDRTDTLCAIKIYTAFFSRPTCHLELFKLAQVLTKLEVLGRDFVLLEAKYPLIDVNRP